MKRNNAQMLLILFDIYNLIHKDLVIHNRIILLRDLLITLMGRLRRFNNWYTKKRLLIFDSFICEYG